MLHTEIHLRLALTTNTIRRQLGTFQKATLFQKSGRIRYKIAFNHRHSGYIFPPNCSEYSQTLVPSDLVSLFHIACNLLTSWAKISSLKRGSLQKWFNEIDIESERPHNKLRSFCGTSLLSLMTRKQRYADVSSSSAKRSEYLKL